MKMIMNVGPMHVSSKIKYVKEMLGRSAIRIIIVCRAIAVLRTSLVKMLSLPAAVVSSAYLLISTLVQTITLSTHPSLLQNAKIPISWDSTDSFSAITASVI